MPLAIAPIPNSLTPNKICLPFLLLILNIPSPPIALVELDKSAEPPIQLFLFLFKYLITSPEDALVAIFFSISISIFIGLFFKYSFNSLEGLNLLNASLDLFKIVFS
jgi:hypothetical protein